MLLLAFGLLGFVMRRFGLPVLPLILGVIIGPRAELQLRRALQTGGGDPACLLSEPLALGSYVVLAVVLAWPLLRLALRTVRRSRQRRAAAPDAPRDTPAGRRS